MAKSKILVGYTLELHPVEGEGEREEGKKLSARFLSKETIQTTAGMAMGGRGSLPGSLSLSIFSCAIIRTCVKVRKGEGKPG